MILALAVILGLVLGLVRRGRGAVGIAGLPLRGLWLAPAALVLQVPLLRAPFCPADEVAVPQALFLLSHLFLLAFVWLNRQSDGIWFVWLGVLCNLAVIVDNGGFMPITPETLVRINPGASLEQCTIGYHYGFSKDIILAQADTRLWLLSDVLVLPAPFPWPTAFSLGDLLLAAGIVGLLQGARPEHEPAPFAVPGVRHRPGFGPSRNAHEQIERRFAR